MQSVSKVFGRKCFKFHFDEFWLRYCKAEVLLFFKVLVKVCLGLVRLGLDFICAII